MNRRELRSGALQLRSGALRSAAPCVAALVLCSWALAAAAAATEPDGYWMGDVDAPVPDGIRGGSVVHTDEVVAMLKRGGIAIIDVSNSPRRPADLAPGAPWLPLAHRALPHAIWIPGAGMGAIAPDIEDFFRARLTTATAGNLEAPMLLYCHDRCWLSWNAAKRAIGFGYRRVSWFPEGIEGWTAAGQPTVLAEAQTPDPVPKTASGSVAAGSAVPKLVVLDLELTGDLGGPEFTAEHEVRLKKESDRLRQDLAHTGLYQMVDATPAEATLNRLRSQQAYLHDCNGCDLDVGRQLNADLVLVAWVDRVSGLILTLTYEIHDVKTSQIVARKSFDFRGDNDSAWNHAIDYMVRDLQRASGQPAKN